MDEQARLFGRELLRCSDRLRLQLKSGEAYSGDASGSFQPAAAFNGANFTSRWLVRLPSPASSPHATVGPIQGSPNRWPRSIGRSNAAVDNRPGDVDRPRDCGIAVSGGWVRSKVRRVPKAIRRKARTKTRAVETRPVEAGPTKTHAAEPEPLSTG